MTLLPEEPSKPPFRSENASSDVEFNAVRIAIWQQLLTGFEDKTISMVDGITILANLTGTLGYHLEKQGMSLEEWGQLTNLNIEAARIGMLDMEQKAAEEDRAAERKSRRFYNRVMRGFRR